MNGNWKKIILFLGLIFVFFLRAGFVFGLEIHYPTIWGLPLNDTSSFQDYICYFYALGTNLAIFIAVIVTALGGIFYLASYGRGKFTTEAKDWIKAGIFGLLIVVCASVIAATISPDLNKCKVGFLSLVNSIIQNNTTPANQLKFKVFQEIPIGTLTETLLTRTMSCYGFDPEGNPVQGDAAEQGKNSPTYIEHDRADCLTQLVQGAEKKARAVAGLDSKINDLMNTCQCSWLTCQPNVWCATAQYPACLKLSGGINWLDNYGCKPWIPGSSDTIPGTDCCPPDTKHQIEHGGSLTAISVNVGGTGSCTTAQIQNKGLDEFRCPNPISGGHSSCSDVVSFVEKTGQNISVNGKIITVTIINPDNWKKLNLWQQLEYFKSKLQSWANDSYLQQDINVLDRAKFTLGKCYLATPYVDLLQENENTSNKDTVIFTQKTFSDPITNKPADPSKYCEGFNYANADCYKRCNDACPDTSTTAISCYKGCNSGDNSCLQNCLNSRPCTHSANASSTFQDCIGSCTGSGSSDNGTNEVDSCTNDCSKKYLNCSYAYDFCKTQCQANSQCITQNIDKCLLNSSSAKNFALCAGQTASTDQGNLNLCINNSKACTNGSNLYAGYPDCLNPSNVIADCASWTNQSSCEASTDECVWNGLNKKCQRNYTASYFYKKAQQSNDQEKCPDPWTAAASGSVCSSSSGAACIRVCPETSKCPNDSTCPQCPCSQITSANDATQPYPLQFSVPGGSIGQYQTVTNNVAEYQMVGPQCNNYSYDDDPLTFYCQINPPWWDTSNEENNADSTEPLGTQKAAGLIGGEAPVGQATDDAENWASSLVISSGLMSQEADSVLNQAQLLGQAIKDPIIKDYCRCQAKAGHWWNANIPWWSFSNISANPYKTSTGANGQKCRQNTDCNSGSCSDTGKTGTTCHSSGDCTSGGLCEGTCSNDTSSIPCTQAQANLCPSKSCVNGNCSSTSGRICYSDSGCNSNNCNGTCSGAPGQACTLDTDCSSGDCWNGTCNNKTCAANTANVGGANTNLYQTTPQSTSQMTGAKCTTDADCSNLSLGCNSNNQCVPGGTGGACTDNSGCQSGPTCGLDNQGNVACFFGGGGTSCGSTADCNNLAMGCNYNQQCVPGGTRGPCTNNCQWSSCDSGGKCVSGGGGAKCTTDSECSNLIYGCNAQGKCVPDQSTTTSGSSNQYGFPQGSVASNLLNQLQNSASLQGPLQNIQNLQNSSLLQNPQNLQTITSLPNSLQGLQNIQMPTQSLQSLTGLQGSMQNLNNSLTSALQSPLQRSLLTSLKGLQTSLSGPLQNLQNLNSLQGSLQNLQTSLLQNPLQSAQKLVPLQGSIQGLQSSLQAPLQSLQSLNSLQTSLQSLPSLSSLPGLQGSVSALSLNLSQTIPNLNSIQAPLQSIQTSLQAPLQGLQNLTSLQNSLQSIQASLQTPLFNLQGSLQGLQGLSTLSSSLPNLQNLAAPLQSVQNLVAMQSSLQSLSTSLTSALQNPLQGALQGPLQSLQGSLQTSLQGLQGITSLQNSLQGLQNISVPLQGLQSLTGLQTSLNGIQTSLQVPLQNLQTALQSPLKTIQNLNSLPGLLQNSQTSLQDLQNLASSPSTLEAYQELDTFDSSLQDAQGLIGTQLDAFPDLGDVQNDIAGLSTQDLSSLPSDLQGDILDYNDVDLSSAQDSLDETGNSFQTLDGGFQDIGSAGSALGSLGSLSSLAQGIGIPICEDWCIPIPIPFDWGFCLDTGCWANPCQEMISYNQQLWGAYRTLELDYTSFDTSMIKEPRSDIIKELTYSRGAINNCSVLSRTYVGQTQLLSCSRVYDEVISPVLSTPASFVDVKSNQTINTKGCYGQKLGKEGGVSTTDNWFCIEERSENSKGEQSGGQ